ncbi:histone H3-like centromeric protein A isoform X4 [Athalia rosae]|uniref:histone H3-like centromeric protein A isoform X4 n=1 Tax=Athalia rosae TaxID=37344 RepID=UPI002034575B|nr:histone H3-like centromeric protein A isoform X4 [Athalia rosae]
MVRRKSISRSSRSSTSSMCSKSVQETHIHPSKIFHSARVKSGTRALQQIRELQKTTKLVIPKASFSRLVREIVFDLFPRHDNYRIQLKALEALQEATEMYMVQFFEDAVLLTLHAKRVTLHLPDMRLLRRLRGRNDIVNR